MSPRSTLSKTHYIAPQNEGWHFGHELRKGACMLFSLEGWCHYPFRESRGETMDI